MGIKAHKSPVKKSGTTMGYLHVPFTWENQKFQLEIKWFTPFRLGHFRKINMGSDFRQWNFSTLFSLFNF